ncbi:hypothetical protein ITR00_02030 [Pediococcus pentosaceus]|uniref:hypothetical protein n=1 Tax=Pediococcus pentosaceus TaxID=1255 RepID=UPI00190A9E4E|nr:hypothetical protein [Pediococcus pentosaceus]MBF7124870.1 hypothetical protein [Pediococcus pentosaceus]WPK16712.1 hypothetical protein R6U75_00550 [Pediococcus pentosaceus]
MMKYTTKELTRIQGTHDPYNCEIINCDVCARFWSYARGLRQQSSEEIKKGIKGKLNEKQQALKVLSKIKFTNVSDLINKYSIALRTAIKVGCSIREIAFELDCRDSQIAKALDNLKLKPKTRAQLKLEKYRKQLKAMVQAGYSIKGMTKALGKKDYEGLAFYLRKYDLPIPKTNKLTIEEVIYTSGNYYKRRYFDMEGNEVELRRVNA